MGGSGGRRGLGWGEGFGWGGKEDTLPGLPDGVVIGGDVGPDVPLPTLFCRPEAFSLGDLLRLTVRPDARESHLPCFFPCTSH